MSDNDWIETAFSEWEETFDASPEVTPSELEAAQWIDRCVECEDGSRYLFAGQVYLRNGDVKTAAQHFANAMRKDGQVFAGYGYDTVLACCNADDLRALITANDPKLDETVENGLRQMFGPSEVCIVPRQPFVRNRNMENSYHAVATFETCLLYLHSKYPQLTVADLHNLCYFVDAVYFQHYGLALFGTPARSTAGVSYTVCLESDLKSVLDGVAKHFAGSSAQDIATRVLSEPLVAAKNNGQDILFTAMKTEVLEPSETVRALMGACSIIWAPNLATNNISTQLHLAEQNFSQALEKLRVAVEENSALQQQVQEMQEELILDVHGGLADWRSSLRRRVIPSNTKITAGKVPSSSLQRSNVSPRFLSLRAEMISRLKLQVPDNNSITVISTLLDDISRHIFDALGLKVTQTTATQTSFRVYATSMHSSALSTGAAIKASQSDTVTMHVHVSECWCGDALLILVERGLERVCLHVQHGVQFLILSNAHLNTTGIADELVHQLASVALQPSALVTCLAKRGAFIVAPTDDCTFVFSSKSSRLETHECAGPYHVPPGFGYV